jgi:potassium/hydrogen antiporter
MELSLSVDRLVLIASLLLFGSVLMSALAARAGTRMRVPGALLFLVIGMLAGNDGLGLLLLDDPELVRDIGVVALLVILFEGGLTTKPTDLRLAARPGGLLATVGVVVTAAITAAGSWLVLGLDPALAGLVGAVVASTDAAAVFSAMRTTPLPRRVAAILRFESGANDPVAVMLTVGALAVYEGVQATASDWIVFLLVQLLGGALVGAVLGLGAVALLRRVELGVGGLYPVLAAAVAGMAYGVAATLGASGFVAVYVAGLLIGGLVPRHRRAVLGFHEAMANAAEVGLFLLLGLLVSPSELPGVALPALAVSGVLILVARPAAVALCCLGARLGWREQLAISWAGLRGAVPIVLATFPFTAGLGIGPIIFNVVFFVVLVSVLAQGVTLLPVIRRLGLTGDAPAWAPVAEALPLDGIDVDLVEVHVTADLAIAGQRLRDLGGLDRTLVTAVVRGNQVLIPTGTTRVLDGDVLLLTAQREGDVLARLTAWARGEGAQDGRQGPVRDRATRPRDGAGQPPASRRGQPTDG